MHDAFETVLKSNRSAIIIGSDCPELKEDILYQAFEALEDHDYVIGPSNDGGYYLLGMNELNKGLFENIEWSTDSVFHNTINKIESKGSSWKRLPSLTDLDTLEELTQFPYLLNPSS
jgi:rSAM/selenodomain-associated transferase 1